MAFSDFQVSPSGRAIEQLLASMAVVRRMEDLSRRGRPAVGALDEQLAGALVLDNTERQYVGRWVKSVMSERGWTATIQRRLPGGTVLTSGMIYERRSSPGSDDRFANVPKDLLPIKERVRRAQDIVQSAGLGEFNVDEYLNEKWAEADAEERRWEERYGKTEA